MYLNVEKCTSMYKNIPLSLRIVQSSPPRLASISIYIYFLSLNVLNNLKMKTKLNSVFPPIS